MRESVSNFAALAAFEEENENDYEGIPSQHSFTRYIVDAFIQCVLYIAHNIYKPCHCLAFHLKQISYGMSTYQ